MKRNITCFGILFIAIISLKSAGIFESRLLLTEPLHQHWQIASVVVDGVATVPDATMSGDILYINADHSIQTVLSGIVVNGTWVIDQSNTMITITADDLTTHLRLKILNLSDTQLQIQRVDGEGAITIINFIPE